MSSPTLTQIALNVLVVFVKVSRKVNTTIGIVNIVPIIGLNCVHYCLKRDNPWVCNWGGRKPNKLVSVIGRLRILQICRGRSLPPLTVNFFSTPLGAQCILHGSVCLEWPAFLKSIEVNPCNFWSLSCR